MTNPTADPYSLYRQRWVLGMDEPTDYLERACSECGLTIMVDPNTGRLIRHILITDTDGHPIRYTCTADG